jgi:hypothetical protein
MSDPVSAYVKYRAPFSFDSVAHLIESVRAAVSENWENHSDDKSAKSPDVGELKLPEAARQLADDIAAGVREWSGGDRSANARYFSFCPLSTRRSYVSFWRYADGTIGVGLVAPESVTREVQGDRERDSIELEWDDEKKRSGKPLSSVFEGPQEGEMVEEDYFAWWDKYHALGDTPSIWPQNRQCLLNIIEHLKKALPVREIEIDPRLCEPPKN